MLHIVPIVLVNIWLHFHHAQIVDVIDDGVDVVSMEVKTDQTILILRFILVKVVLQSTTAGVVHAGICCFNMWT